VQIVSLKQQLIIIVSKDILWAISWWILIFIINLEQYIISIIPKNDKIKEYNLTLWNKFSSWFILALIVGAINQWNTTIGGILMGILGVYITFFSARATGLLYSDV
jgi:hypothetical protein